MVSHSTNIIHFIFEDWRSESSAVIEALYYLKLILSIKKTHKRTYESMILKIKNSEK